MKVSTDKNDCIAKQCVNGAMLVIVIICNVSYNLMMTG